MARRRIIYDQPLTPETGGPVYLWLLRLLVPLGTHRSFVSANGFHSDDLAYALGLDRWIDMPGDEFALNTIRARLRQLFAKAEKHASRVSYPPTLQRNLERLAQFVDLNEIDQAILAFCAFIKTDRLLEDTADWLGLLSSVKVAHVLSVLLDVSEDAVRAALSPQGTLGRTGLVSVDRRTNHMLCGKLDLLTDSFGDHLLSLDDDSFATLFRDIARSAPAPQLRSSDFDHIALSLSILEPYLARSLAMQRPGVNIFLHGRPGTGKTQLARLLAEKIGCELLEVSSQDNDGDAVVGERRLRAYRFTQSFFARRRALILFDEAEDIFNDGNELFGRKSTAQTRKAWINTVLEENPIPTLWLSNSVSCLDPAFARRFDMVIEIPVPPRTQRMRLVEESCRDLLPQGAIASIAEHDHLAPALITRAAKVIGCIADTLPAQDIPGAFEHLLRSTLVAQGHPGLSRIDTAARLDTYDPDFVHADANLSSLAEGIRHAGSARLCLYGPPGTGKTAYGTWLATQLGLGLHQRRASDLLSKYVGGTEKNLAKAFHEAESDRALLLLDEVDSFLQDRRGASRSWEITEVNEMLTQMESYRGVLVATTNLVDDLDQAALRRFDLKVKFDYLQAEQAWRLFLRHCEVLEFPVPSRQIQAKIAALRQLTPGDYAAVLRQHRFRPLKTPEALLAALTSECHMKTGGQTRPLGFV